MTGGKVPVACCLACAGGITNNTVSFTNVEKGWVIDGYQLQKSLSIPKVQLINDFEAQGYGLLTLTDDEKIPLTDAKVRPHQRQPARRSGRAEQQIHRAPLCCTPTLRLTRASLAPLLSPRSGAAAARRSDRVRRRGHRAG